MICQNCQSANRQQAKFCKRCGFWLAPNCPFCNAVLPESALFCDQCGRQINSQTAIASQLSLVSPPAPSVASPTAVAEPSQPAPVVPRPASSAGPAPARPSASAQAASPSAAPPVVDSQLQQYIPKELMRKLDAARASGEMVGERRVVTMMFCDVKGSTAAAERLDPEDWTEIINGAFEYMIKPVYRYEGTVARLMGDAILAFFGAPIAHEDDPQRAILAGLEIVTGIQPYRAQIKGRHGIDFDVRVGINTGLVVVGAVGSDLRMEYTALGDAINLAARMEQTATPGTVQIAHDTYKLVKPLFEFEELGGVHVKGKTEPVPAYRALGRKVIAGRLRGIEGLHADLVGREAEVMALRGVIASLEHGVGGIVCVLSEAGMGKSRLIAELRRDVPVERVGDDPPGRLHWHETASLSYESNQP
ncbi:MAG: zinc ribbon domain-containing protein [Chloroflexi bacterium]|nr:zinc ribbon domain-containing protein [Chloroflexota bacterium]